MVYAVMTALAKDHHQVASGILDQGMNAETSEHIFVLLKVDGKQNSN